MCKKEQILPLSIQSCIRISHILLIFASSVTSTKENWIYCWLHKCIRTQEVKNVSSNLFSFVDQGNSIFSKMGLCSILCIIIVIILLFYCFFELHYFLRMILTLALARLTKKKAHIMDLTTINSTCKWLINCGFI